MMSRQYQPTANPTNTHARAEPEENSTQQSDKFRAKPSRIMIFAVCILSSAMVTVIFVYGILREKAMPRSVAWLMILGLACSIATLAGIMGRQSVRPWDFDQDGQHSNDEERRSVGLHWVPKPYVSPVSASQRDTLGSHGVHVSRHGIQGGP